MNLSSSRWVPAEGATLLIPSGAVKHLFVMLTSPSTDGLVVIANLTSIRVGLYHDPSCVVVSGDHPFVSHPSYIAYSRARIVTSRSLSHGVASGDFVPRQRVDDVLFERICKGALASDDLPQKIATFLQAHFANR